MSWRKLGRVFAPDGSIPWMASHAQVPTVFDAGDCLRALISARNTQGRSLVACLDLDRRDPTRVLRVHPEPVLGLGEPGTFDDDGVMPAEIVRRGDELWLYYSGWNQRVSTPYHNAMGLAASRDGGLSFERLYRGPVMDRIAEEPYLAVTPTVLIEGSLWRCWYISGLRWIDIGGKFEPVYGIKYAESGDGVHWRRFPELCVPQRHELEAFSHPCVRKIDGLYRMWFCHRGSRDYRDGAGSYRMGYAESRDGRAWERKDAEAGIEPSSDGGWDSKMICYPFVLECDGRRLMFYNGDGFGRSGFGVAEWR